MRNIERIAAVTAAVLMIAAVPLDAQGRGQARGDAVAQAQKGNREKSSPQKAQAGQERQQQRAVAQQGRPGQQKQQARQGGQQQQKPNAQGRPGGQQQKPNAQQGRPAAQQKQNAQRQNAPGRQNAQGNNPGRGNGQGNAAARGGVDARGNAAGRAESPGRGNAVRGAGRPGWAAADVLPARRVSRPVRLERLPESWRPLARSSDPAARFTALVAARGFEFNDMPVRYTRTGDAYRVMNDRNDLLFVLSDDDARRLGYWDVRRLDPKRVRSGAPAFCRSGAGHPVWGREWCIDKGFGLGGQDGWLWGRHRPDDIIFRRVDDRTRLDRGGLIDVLGSIIFNRLAVHAVTMGLADPLAGSWLGEPAGPRVLTLHSGSQPVAEFVDWDRDGEVDVMYVVSRDDY